MKRYNLKSFREKQGLNQLEMSKKLGISKATIYRRFRELRDSNI